MKLSTPLARITGTLLLPAFLVVALAVAVQGAFATRASIADTFSRQAAIQHAQITLEELLRRRALLHVIQMYYLQNSTVLPFEN